MKRGKYKASINIGRRRRKKSRSLPLFESALIRKTFICLIILGVLVVFLFGSKRYVSAQPKFKSNLKNLELAGGDIYWAKGKARKIVLKSVENSIKRNLPDEKNLNLLSKDIVKNVYEAIVVSPWVNEIWEVKKEYPDKITARFDVRKPEIAVITGEFIVTLDSNGIILPLIFTDRLFREFNALLIQKLRIIVGLNAEVVEMQDGSISIHTDGGEFLNCGEVWNDIRISSALIANSSLNEISDDADFAKLRFNAINVENIGGKASLLASDIIINAEVVNKTHPKRRRFFSIWWGRDKEHAGFGENKVKEKIEMLRKILELNPLLEDISKIDLRFPSAELSPVYKHD